METFSGSQMKIRSIGCDGLAELLGIHETDIFLASGRLTIWLALMEILVPHRENPGRFLDDHAYMGLFLLESVRVIVIE